MSPWKTAEVPLPCRGIPAGENFFEKKKLGVDIIDSSGYNNQAVFSRGSTICGCAGTGRQASLRCWCPNRRVGSNPVSRTITLLSLPYARVVELADSLDSGSSVHYGRAGSSPASRTKKKDTQCVSFFLRFPLSLRIPKRRFHSCLFYKSERQQSLSLTFPI